MYIALAIGPVWFITGSAYWPRGWLTIGCLWGMQLIGGLWFARVDPDLMVERVSAPADTTGADKLATAIIVVLLLGFFICAGIDVHKLHLLPTLPPQLSLVLGLTLFALGTGIIICTFRTNTFASSVVRIQDDRDHHVIDTGPYALVRHPMYAGLIPFFAGLGLLFESTALALFAIPMVIIGFLPRIRNEEATLRVELAGYNDYATRTRWRLFPGIM